MRLRSLAIVSTVAAATLILAGCAGSPEGAETPSAGPDASGAPDATACIVNAKPGAASDAVTVEGSGLDAKISIPADTEYADLERTVAVKGDGAEVKPGDFISARYQIVDAVTGEVLETSERGADGVLPLLLSTSQQGQPSDSTQSPIFLAATECQPLGSEVVLVLPGQQGQNSVIVYVQSLEELPMVASGTDVEAPAGMPAVTLDDKGAPTITIPDGDAPTETKVGLLKEGSGPVVGEGDLVTVQYRGVKWSTGEEFDSSWSRNAFPAQFPTSGVVTGFRMALEGQKVGSQVIVTMPPADGYGASKGHELENETLVFVVDILGTVPRMP